jgi:hypothetical protein
MSWFTSIDDRYLGPSPAELKSNRGAHNAGSNDNDLWRIAILAHNCSLTINKINVVLENPLLLPTACYTKLDIEPPIKITPQ